MRKYWRFIHAIPFAVALATILPNQASAAPPESGATLGSGVMGIFCFKDVLPEAYNGITKASQVKPRLDSLLDKKVCAIAASPVTFSVVAATKLGTIETDLSDQTEVDDIYALTLDYRGEHVWLLWAEKSPEIPI